MNIVGEKVYLRAMEPSDMEAYRKMLNDPSLEQLLGGWSFPVSSAQQQEWYGRVINDRNNLRWSVVRRSDDVLLGMVNLVEIDWKNGVAVHGIRLIQDEEYRHKGYGKDAVKALMGYAFRELRLNRLETTILEYNRISQALYEKCGWVKEGLKRQAVFRKGRYYDLQMWGIVAKEFFDENE